MNMTTPLAKASLAGALLATMLLSACGGGSDTPPPPPDLSGAWAGSWQGVDPALGNVTGTWDANLTGDATGLSGQGSLRGDVDCMDGNVTGTAGSSALTGGLDRTPCSANSWELTAIDTTNEIASGSWTQPDTGATGTFSGRRIAKPSGPQIRYVSPPGGGPDTIVTIVGSSFDPNAANDGVAFGDSIAAGPLLSASSTVLSARAPPGITTAPITLNANTVLSPVAFNADVSSPKPQISSSIPVAAAPQSVAFSPDGRKLYVASAGRVALLSAVSNAVILPNATYPHTANAVAGGIIASPDGRRVYVTAGAAGVTAMDAALIQPIPSESIGGFTAGATTSASTQALAISADGTLLYVADNLPGGVVRIVTLATKSYVSSDVFGADLMPVAVAACPDGSKIYVAVVDPAGITPDSIAVLDAHTGAPLASSPILLGTAEAPAAIAFAPDGRTAYVANRGTSYVRIIDTASDTSVAAIPGMSAPAAIAVSPDGTNVFVSNSGDHSVTIMGTGSGNFTQSLAVPAAPASSLAGIAISPDGTHAYVADALGDTVAEIGSSGALTIALAGSGLGRVSSEPGGVACGANCQARFPVGTVVTLAAVAGSGSSFAGWNGSGCDSGTVTLSSGSTLCTATFNSNSPPPVPSSFAGCFIATAAFGSPMAAEVNILRQFRDRHLLHSAAGREFVRLYYRYSPPIAYFIRKHDSARAVVRAGLWPLIYAVKYPGACIAMVFMLLGAGAFFRRRQRPSGPARVTGA
jgi:YVTN family beta-propeller protein